MTTIEVPVGSSQQGWREKFQLRYFLSGEMKTSRLETESSRPEDAQLEGA